MDVSTEMKQVSNLLFETKNPYSTRPGRTTFEPASIKIWGDGKDSSDSIFGWTCRIFPESALIMIVAG